MKILVTGGAGFIGSNFLLAKVRERPDIDFVNVDHLGYAAHLGNLDPIRSLPNYRFEKLDISDDAAVRACFAHHCPDAVLHFAAESHVDRSILGPGVFIQTNVVGTFNLLEAARETWAPGAGCFYHVSTDEVFGSLGEEGHFSESSAYAPSSPYSASKAASDHLVRAYYRTYGVPVKMSHCSNNYGPLQFPEKLIPLMIANALAGKALPVYGQGANVRDWIHVEDHCAAIWAILERGRPGQSYAVGGNEERSNLEVVRTICRVLAELGQGDEHRFAELIEFVSDRPGHDYRYAIDSTKIRDELGWEPKFSFDDGLRETVRWYVEHPEWVENVRSGNYRQWVEDNYAGRSRLKRDKISA